MPKRTPAAERAMLNRRIASVRYRLSHPDMYVVPGRYTPGQVRALKAKIADMEKQRDAIKVPKKKS